MRMILVILLIISGLAYLSQQDSIKHNKKRYDIYLIALIVFMVLLVGLRTYYNDTFAYRRAFQGIAVIGDFLSNAENLNIMKNPLFYGFESIIRTFTDNYTIFFMICAIFVNISFVRFIKIHADKEDFGFSMYVYVCLGTLMLSMAAQKQILTMAILTYALDALFDRKYSKYYIIVFIAGMFHTYAWLFLFLPLLGDKPWNGSVYLMLIVTMLIMNYFQDVIASFVEFADLIGKDIATEEVFDGNQMNILRVAVYAIVPLVAFIFQGRLYKEMDRKHGIMIQMCTISFMFMLMGTMNGANMFGRSANYFELGMILVMPWLIKKLFNKQSSKLVLVLAMICFVGFYIYGHIGFSYEYSNKTLLQFLKELIKGGSYG